jgi:hypothetical protein
VRERIGLRKRRERRFKIALFPLRFLSIFFSFSRRLSRALHDLIGMGPVNASARHAEKYCSNCAVNIRFSAAVKPVHSQNAPAVSPCTQSS